MFISLVQFLNNSYFGIPHHEQILNESEPQIKLAEYMPKNKDTWIRIAQRENLDEKAFDYATWAFAGMTI